jgi:hypothetical protein
MGVITGVALRECTALPTGYKMHTQHMTALTSDTPSVVDMILHEQTACTLHGMGVVASVYHAHIVFRM